uniref:Integrase core domain containing protein n=1 Tax=Solanum tuberosum TaxID=4113 RepID=M1DBL9_SOLTU
MTKPKAATRITPAQEKSKGIAIKEDAITSKGKDSKLPTTTGKGKGKRPTSARKTITLDPNTPSWVRGVCRAVHVFLADSQSTDLREAGTVVPLEVTSGTDAPTQGKASGTDAQTDGEIS